MKNYKYVLILVICGLGYSCTTNYHKVNLEEQWDTLRPLTNPDKGWYHHMLDNGIGKYLIQDDSMLRAFPGMDHLYLRLAWAYLEPEEGKFNWSYIDDIVDKYVPMGYGISFRISCKETGPAPSSVPLEKNGVRYATPYWVKEAGAKGVVPTQYGSPSWTPDWDDPIFLEKLDNFHKAFAEKYDGKPWVRYVDIGSIGEWGEGHTHQSTRIPPTVSEVKAHIDLHLKHFKNTQLVVTDDLLYWNKPDQEVNELYDYAISKGITLRDDSPLVEWYVDNNLDTWSVSHPHFFEEVYKRKPTIFELQHYGHVKKDGNWLGRNGEDTIPGLSVSGADIFRNSMKLIHPTYIGYHGYLEEWINDNPDLTEELLNLSGYWYFPKSIELIEVNSLGIVFNIEWLNKGVAPAYKSYMLKGRLIPEDISSENIEFEIEDAGNKTWMPGEVSIQKYSANWQTPINGKYVLYIQLFDQKSKKPVDIGLNTDQKNEDYFKIHMVKF